MLELFDDLQALRGNHRSQIEEIYEWIETWSAAGEATGG